METVPSSPLSYHVTSGQEKPRFRCGFFVAVARPVLPAGRRGAAASFSGGILAVWRRLGVAASDQEAAAPHQSNWV